jgi:hypothetical protein
VKIRDLIERLEGFEARYGPDISVVFLDYEAGRFIAAPISDVMEMSELGVIYESLTALPVVMLS